MASIVLLLSELLGGESAASVLAAERYMAGHQSLRESFQPAVTIAAPSVSGTARCEEAMNIEEESFEDLAVSRVALDDLMWP